jgi:hypothetical protein
MKAVIQKLKLHSFVAVLIVLGSLLPVLYTQPAAAAAPTGMCYFESNGQAPAYIDKCTTVFPKGKDSAGHVLSKSKCYDVTGTVATVLSCSSKKLDQYSAVRTACLSHGGKFNEKTHTCSGEAKTYICADGKTKVTDTANCPGDTAVSSGNCSDVSNCDLISKYINPFINFLAALVGVAVVISIVIGGIQYGSSAGDPQKVSAAKNRIRNAIVALLTFLFLYALLNFLIPGGLL